MQCYFLKSNLSNLCVFLEISFLKLLNESPKELMREDDKSKIIFPRTIEKLYVNRMSILNLFTILFEKIDFHKFVKILKIISTKSILFFLKISSSFFFLNPLTNSKQRIYNLLRFLFN